MPRELREQLKKCRHFNGTMNERCEAGVKYAGVRGKEPIPGRGYPLPCLLEPGPTCEQCSPRTEEEIDAMIAEFDRSFAGMAKARKAVVEAIGSPWKKGSPHVHGNVLCPVCGAGRLVYSRAGYNGHIHAQCSTKDCVAWME